MTGQAPELPRHIRLLLPLLRSRPGGVRSRAIARVPEPVIRTLSNGIAGGEGGIRTHGTVSRTQHFQCCQLSRSCTSPDQYWSQSRVPSNVLPGTTACRRLFPARDSRLGASRLNGGEGGIRTHGTLASTTVFETARFNHSRTSPLPIPFRACCEKKIVSLTCIRSQERLLLRLRDDSRTRLCTRQSGLLRRRLEDRARRRPIFRSRR